jgi:hypothetical protein
VSSESFRESLIEVPHEDRDEWLDRYLGLSEAPPDSGLPPGGVPYLPAGVAEVLDAIRDVPIKREDLFVDLGSGLGRVVMLTHLLSGARCHGVEIQRALVDQAIATARRLGLSGVSFECADAATAELDGSVFFLYAPFNGELLRRVLARLEQTARRRPIRLCTVDLSLDDVRWLRPLPTDNLALGIYESR